MATCRALSPNLEDVYSCNAHTEHLQRVAIYQAIKQASEVLKNQTSYDHVLWPQCNSTC
jgi:hypothetical protein